MGRVLTARPKQNLRLEIGSSDQCRLLVTSLKVAVRPLPSADTEPTITIAINDTISPYSIAVAPSS